MLRSVVALAVMACACASACHAQGRTEWDFIVRLDGERIGTHRFTLAQQPDGTAWVTSDAKFEVRFLGWTAYRYAHHSRERWSGGCLAALDARTDDDGHVTQVRASRTGGGLEVDVAGAAGQPRVAGRLPGCAMSFAYWNPALRSRRELLDPGTGRLVDVRITPLDPARVDTDRGPVNARGWRIAGLPDAIDIRWDGDDWVGLDTVVGGRHLSYRLR